MTNTVLWSNNGGTTLASPITTTQTTITLTSGSGALFPSPTSGQFFALSLTQSGTAAPQEIVYCTARSGDALTVTRAQESTPGTAFNAGDLAQNLITAGTMDFGDFPTGLSTLSTTATLTGANAGNFYNVGGSGVVATLNASTFNSGQTIGFLAQSACTITASSGTFYGGSLSGSSFAMPVGSIVALQRDGANWRQLAGSFLIAPSSLASSGWKKYPDSTSPTGYFIEQWGTGTITSLGAGVTSNGFALPIAFPSEHLICLAAYAGTNPVSILGAIAGSPGDVTTANISIYTSAATTSPAAIQFWSKGY